MSTHTQAMSTPTLHSRRSRRPLRVTAISLLLIASAAISSAPAWASAAEEQQGAALLAQVQNGQTSCSKLSPGQSELMGEYVMGRMLGSTTTHNAMNARLKVVMGARGEQQAHEFMGARFAGCATGTAPAGFGTMMNMMGAGMMGASSGYGAQSGNTAGSMMGGSSIYNAQYGNTAGGTMGHGYQSAHAGGMSTGTVVAIILGTAALLSLLMFVAVRRPGARKPPLAGTA